MTGSTVSDGATSVGPPTSPAAPQPRSAVPPSRLSEPSKWLPVAFVCGIIFTLYFCYVFCHLFRLLQFDVAPAMRDHETELRGWWQGLVFHFITLLLVLCYIRSVHVHPGSIPDRPEWIYDGAKEIVPDNVNNLEKKRTGDRRHCKWCHKYKPDRCHHCRVCRMCILKMDHHCPWIYNCVGFYNHKYFFLLLLYTTIDCHWITWTMVESVQASVEEETPFWVMFFCLFGTTLASFLGLLVTAFFMFHIWLMTRAMTTIDFCEKSLKRSSYETMYDLGPWGNLKAVLGPHFLLFFLPISTPEGDGLSFTGENTRLNADTQHKNGRSRKKGHNSAQRGQGDPEGGMNEQSVGRYSATDNTGHHRSGEDFLTSPDSLSVDIHQH